MPFSMNVLPSMARLNCAVHRADRSRGNVPDGQGLKTIVEQSHTFKEKKLKMRTSVGRVSLLFAISLLVNPVGQLAHAAEGYPTRPIQVIVPFPPGGSLDVATRILAPRMSAILGVPLVIVPKPGASGAIGASTVLNAPADGYTIASTFNSTLTLIHLNTKGLPYTYKDFTPIGNFAVDVNAIVVKGDSRWKNLDELFGEIAKNPSKLNYGSPGIGSVSSLAMDVIKTERKLDVTNVPFPGSPPVNTAVLGNQVDFGTVAFSSAIPLMDDGQLRVLGISGTERFSKFPDLRTFREQGIKNADLSLKAGLYVSAKTPPAIVAALEAAFNAAVKDPEVATAIEKAGLFQKIEDAAAAKAAIEQEDVDVQALGRMMAIGK